MKINYLKIPYTRTSENTKNLLNVFFFSFTSLMFGFCIFNQWYRNSLWRIRQLKIISYDYPSQLTFHNKPNKNCVCYLFNLQQQQRIRSDLFQYFRYNINVWLTNPGDKSFAISSTWNKGGNKSQTISENIN